MLRLVKGDVFFKRGRGFIFACFYFHGDNLCAVLKYKVNFTVFIRIIVWRNLKLSVKLLQHIVFS